MAEFNTREEITQYCKEKLAEFDKYISMIDNYAVMVNELLEKAGQQIYELQYIRNVRNQRTYNVQIVDALCLLAREVRENLKNELLNK